MKSTTIRLNVEACSTMSPCAAPEITTSSAWGMRSAISSLSARGVRMSWLPTTTSVGTEIWESSATMESSVSRMAATCLENPVDGRNVASGPSHPIAGARRRNDRGPTIQRMDSSAHCRIPLTFAVSAQYWRSSVRQGRLRQAVQASVSERTRSGYLTATIWEIAPPIDAPTMCAVRMP